MIIQMQQSPQMEWLCLSQGPLKATSDAGSGPHIFGAKILHVCSLSAHIWAKIETRIIRTFGPTKFRAGSGSAHRKLSEMYIRLT
jgi:hypothetical protein